MINDAYRLLCDEVVEYLHIHDIIHVFRELELNEYREHYLEILRIAFNTHMF